MPGLLPPPTIVLFRDDLRLADHPALCAAAARGPVLGLYVLDEISPGRRPLGAAAHWWLHHSLAHLGNELSRHGVRLALKRGPLADCVADVARESGADRVFWNRPPGEQVDGEMRAALGRAEVGGHSFDAELFEGPLRTSSGSGYRVFSAFWRAARALPWTSPLPAQPRLQGWTGDLTSDRLDDWGLLPQGPDWAAGLRAEWRPGAAGATAALEEFLGRLEGYEQARDFPAAEATSRLSPHLRFGEITARQVATAVANAAPRGPTSVASRDKFLSELGWRAFCQHLRVDFPELATRNVNPRFDAFPWRDDPAALRAWQRGRTGYPIVDAGMRQLWATGWMHNRLRMVVASFLTKHLLIDWRAGEAWFWDTLVDADPANNPAGWQWVAGSGADAAPYFRIFNPVLQGEKFDPQGRFTRRYVPELAGVPDRYLQRPWDFRSAGATTSGLTGYPAPLVDHATARQRALDAYGAMRAAG